MAETLMLKAVKPRPFCYCILTAFNKNILDIFSAILLNELLLILPPLEVKFKLVTRHVGNFSENNEKMLKTSSFMAAILNRYIR